MPDLNQKAHQKILQFFSFTKSQFAYCLKAEIFAIVLVTLCCVLDKSQNYKVLNISNRFSLCINVLKEIKTKRSVAIVFKTLDFRF